MFFFHRFVNLRKQRDRLKREAVTHPAEVGLAKPVLTIGSLHLSLMAAIGLWLWSDPSKFGTPITGCDPSLTVVGGAVPFSTPGLRIFSLVIYSVLVIPALNLVPPFLFFLALHITYNSSPPCGSLSSRGICANAAGLFCLAIINVILLVDIELTLGRNKRFLSGEDNEWGFGQVLALLLLVVPLRDFLSSILDIQEKVEEKRRIQSNFEERLRGGVEGRTVEAEIFEDLIERGADPTVEIEGALPVNNLLELAASRGNEDLVRYLQEVGVEDKGGRAFFAAAWNKQCLTASLLKDGNKSYMAEQLQPEIRAAILSVVKMLEDSDWSVRQAAIECITCLAAQEQLRQEIRPAIPSLVKMLEDSDWRVCQAAITCITSLAGQENPLF
ncbi:hypothetical protein B0H13DRAFT_1887364 [Mycena leptocephala]|nr:hypothetical protein B0H13DRAFT_1887364 [Mycena leptocephala]